MVDSKSVGFEVRAEWPAHIPLDLHLRLLDLMSYGVTKPQDTWDELREWLVEHGAQPTKRIVTLPSEVEPRPLEATKYSQLSIRRPWLETQEAAPDTDEKA